MLMSEPHANLDICEVGCVEFEAAARLTPLRLELALAMQTLRVSVGLTEEVLASPSAVMACRRLPGLGRVPSPTVEQRPRP
jgi:hypothetical protein